MTNGAPDAFKAMNTLAKWKSLFAGWQLGSRPIGDPECDAVRDHREATLLLRAEMSALVTLLVDKQVITLRDWRAAVATEATQLSKDLAAKFPGVTAHDHGLTINPDLITTDWMAKWKP